MTELTEPERRFLRIVLTAYAAQTKPADSSPLAVTVSLPSDPGSRLAATSLRCRMERDA